MAVRQSFCYPIYKGDLEFAELFRAAKGMGYAATEWWGWNEESEEAAARAKEAGLAVASFTGHDSIEKGLADPDEFERIEGELRESLDRAARIGCPGVICFPGGRDGRRSDLEALAETIRALRRLAPLAEEKGVNLNVEILNSRVDHPGYLADTVEWGVALCEGVGSPRVKLLFDVYHVQIMQGDLVSRIGLAGPHVGHVHTAGVPGRHELDDRQEIRYAPVMRALSDGGYEGYVGHEFFPNRLSRLDSLREAYAACAV